MPKNLLAFVDSPADFSFCLRLRHGLHAKGFRLVVLTPKPSLIISSYLRSVPCHLVKNSDNSATDLHVNATTEVLAKKIGERDAARYYFGVMEVLERVHRIEGISVMLIRNGNSIPAKAMSQFAQQYSVATLFYEPSHIRGRLFVDPRGVDAQSLLFQKPEILDRFTVKGEEFDRWRESYLKRRAAERSVNPDLSAGSERRSVSLLDIAGGLFYSLPPFSRAAADTSARPVLRYDAYETEKGSFNYFPMQSSRDSRVMFNSSISLQDAVDIAYDKSSSQQRDLLIQPHPHEDNKEIFDYLASMRSKKGLFIVNGSSYRFVERCNELITINSVLSADALLAGKKVTFLGATFYAQMNDDRLKKFLLGYLLDIDYYAKESIPTKQVEAMLSRLLLQ
jgi:capsular polysaccharide export protein